MGCGEINIFSLVGQLVPCWVTVSTVIDVRTVQGVMVPYGAAAAEIRLCRNRRVQSAVVGQERSVMVSSIGMNLTRNAKGASLHWEE